MRSSNAFVQHCCLPHHAFRERNNISMSTFAVVILKCRPRRSHDRVDLFITCSTCGQDETVPNSGQHLTMDFCLPYRSPGYRRGEDPFVDVGLCMYVFFVSRLCHCRSGKNSRSQKRVSMALLLAVRQMLMADGLPKGPPNENSMRPARPNKLTKQKPASTGFAMTCGRVGTLSRCSRAHDRKINARCTLAKS